MSFFVGGFFFILRVKMSHLQSKGLGHTNINSFNHIPKAFFLQNLEKKHTSQNLLNQEIFKFFLSSLSSASSHHYKKKLNFYTMERMLTVNLLSETVLGFVSLLKCKTNKYKGNSLESC